MDRPMPRPPPVTSACRPSRIAIKRLCANPNPWSEITLSFKFLAFKQLRRLASKLF
jgi:hypothetical protein